MEETTNNSELSKRYNPHEDRYYTVAEVRKMNAAYQQRCRKRAKLKKLGAEVKKYLDEYKSKATGSEFRLAQLRFRDGMRLPSRWQDEDLEKSLRSLQKLKRNLVDKMYGKGAPSPSVLAMKMVNVFEKNTDSWEAKLDAIQSLMEYVGMNLDLLPKDQLPMVEGFVTCALACKLTNLPEWSAQAVKQRLEGVLPFTVYAEVMDGKLNRDMRNMQAMLGGAVTEDDKDDEDEGVIDFNTIAGYLR